MDLRVASSVARGRPVIAKQTWLIGPNSLMELMLRVEHMYVCVCVCTHISIMFLPHHSAEPSACVNCALRAQPPYCAVINDEASLLVCNCTLTLGVSYLCNVVGMNEIES